MKPTSDSTATGAAIAGHPSLIQWLASGHRGISSDTIVTHLTGLNCMGGWCMDHPYDPDDLLRCERLLNAVPLLRPLMPAMGSCSPTWAALVPEWDSLVREVCREAPEWRKGRGSAPLTFKRMRALLDGVRKPASAASGSPPPLGSDEPKADKE